MTRQTEATVYLTRWDAAERAYVRRPVATLPVMAALRVARDIADRNPVDSSRYLTCYARPISTLVRLGPPSDAWRSPDDVMEFDAEVRIVPSVGELGWTP